MTERWLERYRNGEREAVWQDLVALGPRVRDPAHLTVAQAVARETMHRVQQNLETIVERLRARGYAFTYPNGVLRAPNAELLERIDRLEAQAGPLPIAFRAFYEVVGEVCLMGSLPGLSSESHSPSVADLVVSTGTALGGPVEPAKLSDLTPEVRTLLESMPPDQRQLIMQARGMAEEIVHRADQTGPERHALTRTLFEQMKARRGSRSEIIASDPIVIEAPHSGDINDYEQTDPVEDPRGADGLSRYIVNISPDATHKANMSGGAPYTITFPDPVADAPIVGLKMTLVEYLRVAFRWGGFPGLTIVRPEASVDWLTIGLLDI